MNPNDDNINCVSGLVFLNIYLNYDSSFTSSDSTLFGLSNIKGNFIAFSLNSYLKKN